MWIEPGYIQVLAASGSISTLGTFSSAPGSKTFRFSGWDLGNDFTTNLSSVDCLELPFLVLLSKLLGGGGIEKDDCPGAAEVEGWFADGKATSISLTAASQSNSYQKKKKTVIPESEGEKNEERWKWSKFTSSSSSIMWMVEVIELVKWVSEILVLVGFWGFWLRPDQTANPAREGLRRRHWRQNLK